MNLRIIDLHTHSAASDGALSPADLVETASARGVGVMALTDHDTTAGCEQAASAAKVFSVEFVSGIEISSVHDEHEFHVLGYFVDPSDRTLLRFEQEARSRRIGRAEQIVSILRSEGMAVRAEDVTLPDRIPTRHHVAQALVEGGFAMDVKEAFARFLSPGCVAYVPAGLVDVKSAIDLIHGAGGVASLAHPGEWTSEDHIRTFRSWGLDAIEIVHPSHGSHLVDYYDRLADKVGLLRTGGSDFHDLNNEVSTLGRYRIDESWYGEILNRRGRGTR